MNLNNDNESKNNMDDKLSSLSSSIQSGLKSLTKSSSSSLTSGDEIVNSSNSDMSSKKILGLDWKFFVLIIFIFALLGVNIFVYLAVGTQDVINAIKPITTALSNLFHAIFKGSILNIFKNAIQGVHDLLFIAQGTIKGGVYAADKLSKEQTENSSLNYNTTTTPSPSTPSPSTQSYKQPTSLPQTVASNGSIKNSGQYPTSQPIPPISPSIKNISAQNVANSIPLANSLNSNALDKALNTALIEDTNGSMNNNMSNTFNYKADDSMSNIQQSKSTSKSGWCFIGEDRGFRSCIQVNENEKCMSGDIFPSQEICINPNLRQ